MEKTVENPVEPIYTIIGIILIILIIYWRKQYKINKEAKHRLAVERKMEELRNKENKKDYF